jgi:hypothetical protein
MPFAGVEEQTVPEKPTRRWHVVASRTPEEGDANIAALIAAGEADRGDCFIRLVPLEADPDSHMFENYNWEGRWVRKDGRDDAAIARENAEIARLRASGS